VRLFLDTNAYSVFMRGRSGLDAVIEQATTLGLSVVTLGELEQGFRNGSQYLKNRAQLNRFLEHPQVEFFETTRAVAERYGQIWAELKRKGRPIPTNDVWIAAQTLESGGTLLSSDRHFEAIEGLSWIHPGPSPSSDTERAGG